MKHPLFICILITVGFGVIITSCKKVDKIPPGISISTPPANSYYNTFDTIWVEGVASDDQNLESIKVSVVDENLIPVLTGRTLFPDQSINYSFRALIEINDKYLDGGQYHIQAKASDGRNEKNTYTGIQIGELQKELVGLFFITEQGMGNTRIYKQFLGDDMVHWITINHDYSSSQMGMRNNQMYVFFNDNRLLYSLELIDGGLMWEMDAASPYPRFTDHFFHDKYLFVADENGGFMGIRDDATVVFNKGHSPDTLIEQLVHHNDLLIAESVLRSGGKRFLSTYYSNGFFKQRRSIDFQVVDMFSGPEEVFVFGNSVVNSNLYVYYEDINYHEDIMEDLPADLLSVEQINPFLYLLRYPSDIYLLDVQALTADVYFENMAVDFVRYEEVNAHILLGTGDELKVFAFPSKTELYDLQYSESLLNVEFLYNK